MIIVYTHEDDILIASRVIRVLCTRCVCKRRRMQSPLAHGNFIVLLLRSRSVPASPPINEQLSWLRARHPVTMSQFVWRNKKKRTGHQEWTLSTINFGYDGDIADVQSNDEWTFLLVAGLMAAEAVAAMLADDLATKALSEKTADSIIYKMYKNLPVENWWQFSKLKCIIILITIIYCIIRIFY